MEGALAADFSGVRVHTGPTAQQAASALRAHAFTSGTDIMFGAGEYRPGTLSGDRLIAHELTHVVQQRQGVHLDPIDGGRSDPHEVEAEQTAARVVDVDVNAPEHSTSSDMLRSLGIYAATKLFGGRIPAAVMIPLNCLLRIAMTMEWPSLLLYRAIQTLYDLYLLGQHTGDHDLPDAQGRRPRTNLVIDSLFGGLPDLLADCLTLFIVAEVQMAFDQTEPAGRTLRHYRDGTGTDLSYSAEDLFGDPGFRHLVAGVNQVGVPTRLTMLTDDWKTDNLHYTFGEVDHLTITILDRTDPSKARVHVLLADRYQWHPDELRVSRVFHAAMENMKMAGAREFWQRVDQVVEVDLTR
ncbi:hypothetical protein GCM10010174_19520 [Kutzneria viridogrisea]